MVLTAETALPDLDLAVAGEAVFQVTCDKPRRPTNRS
jgi:hypothetical protein